MTERKAGLGWRDSSALYHIAAQRSTFVSPLAAGCSLGRYDLK